jgi:DNA-binding transcriptional regulator YhcF (GntR family)
MRKTEMINLINVDKYSVTPKYLQIVNCVIREIENGNIHDGDNMPSINELSDELDISRDTVERGYRHLKNIDIIDAVPRQGYYIKNTQFKQPLKIFLLFNKLSAHKKTIYDSFVASLGDQAIIDFYIYNNDFLLFKNLLTNKKFDYTHYVIIPHFIEGGENASELINAIPKHKLVILDKLVSGITGEYSAAYENFEKNIYTALNEAVNLLAKYHTLKIIFPAYSYYPPEILSGFKQFCHDNAFTYKVVSDIANETVNDGEVYINVMEDDLVILIEKIISSKLEIGKQIGIISYNETPIKNFILNGITTISTDFCQMGITASQLVLSNIKQCVEVPFKLTLRASL